MKTKYSYLIIFFSVAVCLVIAFFLDRFFYKPLPFKNSENHQMGFKYISPLLDCENSQPLDRNFKKLKENIENDIQNEIEKENVSTVSLYMRDLNNGPWIGIDEKEKFSPTSLMKVPLMMAYLKISETKPAILDQKLKVIDYETDTLSQNILPTEKLEINKEYTVQELINRSIKYSDNVAANTLLANIEPADLDKIYSDLNIPVPSVEDSENYMTITEYSSFFRILYNAPYLSKETSEKALNILTTASFDSGLNAKLPKDVVVSHKFGERIFENKKQLHDCGIIYMKNSNYLLCVMTRGDDFKLMEDAISTISKNIYDQMLSFTKN